MENHTDIKAIRQAWDDAELESINAWSKLTGQGDSGYSVGAAAKSAAGIGTPSMHLELTHAPIAWFFVSVRPPLFGVLLAELATGTLSVMVARAGQSYGWPVSSGCAGSSNPARATAMRLEPLCGSDNLLHLEAANMATVPTPITPVIKVIDGQAVTTSLDLAEYFGKNHRDVLRKIETLDCSLDFIERNFALISYTDGLGRKKPCYQLTRDGFFFVAMGFTGRRAAEFKEAYIAAFNRMERQLVEPIEQYMARLDNEYVTDTLRHTITFWESINGPWNEVIYPTLVALKSPLAVHQVDRYAHMGMVLLSLASQLGVSVEGTKRAKQGGRKHG
ncbi:Rha family transcriptional regulator [Aeromonas veronii]|uniref:Rha family phage regulatory protein n=1 Tax=Aeromonas veronii TaxID=654 RepID=UPI0025A99BB1|nr:Rha family phage regulatory protein [Aeromonas veronii]MCO4171833.1 Rha family transcriptional regulator [Aeromonas veronii]